MTATKARRGVPLTDEALRRRLSYNQLLRLVLLGKVVGWKQGSRWMVEPSANDAEPVTASAVSAA